MPSLLVYLPGKQGADPELLRGVGLGELLDGAAVSFFQADRGPDSAGGAIAYWGHELPRLDDFEFEPAKPRGELPAARFWLGKPKAGKLKPEELARKSQHFGADLLLADGQAWRVPIARELPQLLGLGDDGEWGGVVVPQYREFFNAAWKALDWLAPDEHGRTRIFKESVELAASALSINYRVNRDVASFLGLLTSENVAAIARAVVEFDAIVAAQKKSPSPPDTPSSDAGPPG